MKLQPSFGQFLRESGKVSTAVLDDAARGLILLGGRLGTNLVRSGALGVDDLERYLAEFQDLPCPPAEWLEEPSSEAIGLLPQKFMRLHGVLPLQLEGGHLHVAMRDPDEAVRIDALRRVAGRPVVTYAISEVRLAFLQEKLFGWTPPASIEGLRGRWNQRRGGDEQSEQERAESEEQNEARAAFAMDFGSGAELSDPDSFDGGLPSSPLTMEPAEPPAAPAQAPDPTPRVAPAQAVAPAPSTPLAEAPPAPARSQVAPSPLADAEQRLVAGSDRDEVARAALEICATFSEAACLFAVYEGKLLGSLSIRAGEITDLRGIVMAGRAQSCLTKAVRTGRAVQGPPDPGRVDARLFKALGYVEPNDLLVLPVRAGERILAVIAAECSQIRFGPVAGAALRSVAECLGASFGRLIQERRASYRQEPSG